MAHRILRMSELKTNIGLANSTIYDKLDPSSPRHDPTFPRSVSLGGRARGWLESEVDEWIEQQLEKRTA